jgi:hypothetical protein
VTVVSRLRVIGNGWSTRVPLRAPFVLAEGKIWLALFLYRWSMQEKQACTFLFYILKQVQSLDK